MTWAGDDSEVFVISYLVREGVWLCQYGYQRALVEARVNFCSST
jgi:hypothetical protein